MYVIICGGRDERLGVEGGAFLDSLHSKYTFTLAITGGARGIDKMVDMWAGARGIDRLIVPANWNRDDKAAGPIRNTRMLRTARQLAEAAQQFLGLVAFPGGNGTANMVKQAEVAGVKVVKYQPRGMDG